MKVPNALTRDDTEHGVYYYLASEVDALLQERDAEIRLLKASDAAWKKGWEQSETKLAAQRKVLEQAVLSLRRFADYPNARTQTDFDIARHTITAIQEQLA